MRSLVFLTLFVCVNGYSQGVENFTYLKSQAPIPIDFTMLSTEKFKIDFEANVDENLDDKFFLETRFFIDELLLSGLVLFNEPLSNYINKVADYVLYSYTHSSSIFMF